MTRHLPTRVTLARDINITIPFLRESFWLVPPMVRWRVRPRYHFANKQAWVGWNSRFAGTGCRRPERQGLPAY
jgi:hypothetical protein